YPTACLCLCRSVCRPPTSTLFPYTTLFRSSQSAVRIWPRLFFSSVVRRGGSGLAPPRRHRSPARGAALECCGCPATSHRANRVRSEEHTSELQSRENLVCRLLLENKKHDTR